MGVSDIKKAFNEKCKVLVVDDVPSARKIVVRILKNLGVEFIETANNGKEALEKIRAGGVGLVISDWDMPEMDGIELVKILRSEQKTKALPFIIISSSADPDTESNAAGSGATDFVAKPFTSEMLGWKISMVLRQ